MICGRTIYNGNLKENKFYLLKWSKFLYVDNKFSKDFTNHRKNTNRANFWPLLRGQPHSPDANHCAITISARGSMRAL